MSTNKDWLPTQLYLHSLPAGLSKTTSKLFFLSAPGNFQEQDRAMRQVKERPCKEVWHFVTDSEHLQGSSFCKWCSPLIINMVANWDREDRSGVSSACL